MEYSFIITWNGGSVFGNDFPEMDAAEAAGLRAAELLIAGGAKGLQVIVGTQDDGDGVVGVLNRHTFDEPDRVGRVPVNFMVVADVPLMLKERIGDIGPEGGVKAEVCRDAVAGMTWQIRGPNRVATFNFRELIHDLAAEVLKDA